MEILTITPLPGRYLVDFESGDALELSEKTLTAFVVSEGMNYVYDVDDLMRVNAVNYLEDNYELVIRTWIAKQEIYAV